MSSNLKYIAFDNIRIGIESLAQNEIAPKTTSSSQVLLNTDLRTSFIYYAINLPHNHTNIYK